MDEEIRELVRTLVEGQIRTDKSVNGPAVIVSRYVDPANARMMRIEENLDGLIRAITREHNYGKAH